MIDPNIPAFIATRLREFHAVDETQCATPGMSGASVYCCLSKAEPVFALRAWPVTTLARRVAEVHRVVSRVRDNGCKLVPRYVPIDGSGATFWADSRNRIWELAQWMPGRPLKPDATIGEIGVGGNAIGRFHVAAASIGQTLQPCLAVRSRLKRLEELNTLLRGDMTRTIPQSLPGRVPSELVPPLEQATHWLGLNGMRAADETRNELKCYQDLAVSTQYVLRDVHREHVLFDFGTDHLGVRATAILDFDAIRVDTPASDLSRWVTSFPQWPCQSDEIWRATLAGYVDQTSFSDAQVAQMAAPEFRELVFALAKSSIFISLANWVVWLLVESRTFPVPQQVAKRIGELLDQLTTRPRDGFA
ncbi:phosphotransferase [Stieleria varia]|uniref:Phosphotransferase enzyme family protein n=1 Tax=Stieleria varia TaxID=2528005 RepID=A0A5C6AXI3_9BACT|nr:phosphotransferase [Stieleria varia]TWU04715.1 Phosphotransferase enzyme family protein [Stieleria varia]